jgi:hypothetical protein
MIPEDTQKTPKVAEKYAKINYGILASYYTKPKKEEE